MYSCRIQDEIFKVKCNSFALFANLKRESNAFVLYLALLRRIREKRQGKRRENHRNQSQLTQSRYKNYAEQIQICIGANIHIGKHFVLLQQS